MYIIKSVLTKDERQRYFNKSKKTYWDSKENATAFMKFETAQRHLDILEKKWRNVPNLFKPPLVFELSKRYEDTPINKVYIIEKL